MSGIKIKLSLSGASLAGLQASASAPTATSKGKGKVSVGFDATAGTSTPSSAYSNGHVATHNGSEWGNGFPASAGPSRQSNSLGPAFSPHTPVSTASKAPKGSGTPKSSPKPKARSKAKSKLGRLPKSHTHARQSQSAPNRPTAIPSHVYSGPSTPLASPGQMAPPPLPFMTGGAGTPSPAPESRFPSGTVSPGGWDDVDVKEEMDIDGEGYEGSPDPLSLPATPADEEGRTPHGRGRAATKWVRLRKPLKELLGKIMVELRRRDEYALFSEPVNIEDFPTYLAIIGGADKMMDLSTMQNKIDNGEYRTIDAMEADLRLLVSAAQTFNPAGTVPYRSANTVLTYGLKHIERYRPLVITPSPSPVRETTSTPGRFQSVDADGEPIDPTPVEVEIPPTSRIPVEMLEYPSNSLVGLAVGWNLNGGKKVYIKRELRTRERFSGKWRHFDYDGTRNLAEMDDVHTVLAPTAPKTARTVLDWKGLRREGGWWDWPGVGGVYGQPPVPFTRNPVRPPLPTRELDAMEWGVYPDIQQERLEHSRRRTHEAAGSGEVLSSQRVVELGEEVLDEQLRPTIVRDKGLKRKREPGGVAKAGDNGYINTYDARRPGEYLRDMEDGDLRGEAYRTSVRKFLEGALASAKSTGEAKLGEAEGLEELQRYIQQDYNGGVLTPTIEPITRRTVLSLQNLADPTSPSAQDQDQDHDLIPSSQMRRIAASSHARMNLRYLLRAANPLDIAPFIRAPQEFGLPSTHAGMDGGLKWVSTELEAMDREQRRAAPSQKSEREEVKEEEEERVSPAKKARTGTEADTDTDGPGAREASSPLSTAPSTPIPATATATSTAIPLDRAERLKAIRLEILALCKFFPLTGLKPLSKALADKMLPVNVRGLLSAPE